MAYEEETAARFRELAGEKFALTEKRMMGGLCFLHNGHMVGGVDTTKAGVERFMFRVGKENDVAASKLPGAQPMEQGGRRMTGLFFVDANGVTEKGLSRWMSLAAGFVRELPPK